MSFIQFESGWEKEKVRQELREVRQELLRRAEEKAKKRDEQDLKKQFRGDNDWMLPSVSNKIDEMSGHKKKKEKKKKSKKSSKSKKEKKEKKKRKSKKRKHSSSSDSATSSDDEPKKRRKHSESSDSESDSESDAWVESTFTKNEKLSQEEPLKREDWLGGLTSISTFSRAPKPDIHKKSETHPTIAYEPGKCSRELNPYWKNGGDGLPKQFSKPKNDSDESDDGSNYRTVQRNNERQSNWRKKPATEVRDAPSSSRQRDSREKDRSPKRRRSRSTSSSSSAESNKSPERKSQEPAQSERANFLTDQQMNELGAKLLKAEMLGNDDVVKELKDTLERAREYRSTQKVEILSKAFERRSNQKRNKNKDDVLLTETNSKGYSRPVMKNAHNDSDMWGGRSGRKAKKSKLTETHMDGERVRYFADDDKYDIKQMFEAEKFTSAADQDMQFANIAGKHKNPNDNLDELFTDKIRKGMDDGRSDQKERDRAIKEHQNMQRTLDTCNRCFDSSTFAKQMIVSMGKNVYLALPDYEGIQTGHCIIAPFSHVSCATLLEDDVWQEMRDFMKALDRMFYARKQDVIFFETARYLNRRPHMQIHCVPSKGFELAPFHFKKAIQESEDDWATNKQLVSLKDRDVRRAIPKGLPYFWVNFGMSSGFAHVIEDQEKFPANFAQEIIGGLLNLDARLWRRPRKLNNPIPKVKQFADWWKSYDVTK